MTAVTDLLLSVYGPILVLAAGGAVVLLFAAPLSRWPGAAAAIGAVTTISAGALSLVRLDAASLATLALCAVALIGALLVPALQPDLQEPSHVAESMALMLVGTAGAVALAGAADLLQAVVGLETLALASVTLVALGRGSRPMEASFKYFVLGALSLAGLLYGLGLVYLGTGSFNFPTGDAVTGNAVVLTGVVLVGLALAFELAVFPFHWGALDAYTAAASPLAGWVMSASKIAAAAVLAKLVLGLGAQVGQLFVWLGLLTIIWGTVGAMAQSELRRMLAYSAITHAGFIALAVGAGPDGPVVAQFYAATYGTMAMLVFAALAGRPWSAGPTEGGIAYDGVAQGLGPLRATALALGLFALSGIPPTPGFWAKLAVLVVAWQSVGVFGTLIAVAGGVLAVLYYLRPMPDLLAAMRAPGASAVPRSASAPAVLAAAALVVALSIFPGAAWALARIP